MFEEAEVLQSVTASFRQKIIIIENRVVQKHQRQMIGAYNIESDFTKNFSTCELSRLSGTLILERNSVVSKV